MKHFLILLIASISIASSAIAGGPQPDVDPLFKTEGMVRLSPASDVTPADFIDWFNGLFPTTPVTVLDSIEGRRIYLFEVDVSSVNEADLPLLLDSMGEALETQIPIFARWAEFNYFGAAPEGRSGSTWVTGLTDLADYQGQFTRDLIGFGAAQLKSDGHGTAVAVLDTGIDLDHPALQGKLLSNGYDFVRNEPGAALVLDGIDSDEDGDIDEMSGHGTFVAGLITLVAPETRILPVVVLDDDGVTDLWTMIQGMFFAIDRGVEVINMSLSTTYRSIAVEEAIAEARIRGIAIVAAAGNLDREDPRENPAMQSGAIGVSATSPTDIKAGFSNFHDKLMLSAPGIGQGPVLDPAQAIIGPIPGGEYAIWDGTSFATAFVSGSAALIRAQHPEWGPDTNTLLAIEGVLCNTATNIDGLNPFYAGMLGTGRLNTTAAIGVGPPAPQVGDVNHDTAVNIDDLILLLLSWGSVHASTDLNVDGLVDVDDLIIMLLNWT